MNIYEVIELFDAACEAFWDAAVQNDNDAAREELQRMKILRDLYRTDQMDAEIDAAEVLMRGL